jgi:hypothetical protein
MLKHTSRIVVTDLPENLMKNSTHFYPQRRDNKFL